MASGHKAKVKSAKSASLMPEASASDRVVAEFWDTHSVADYWDELESVEPSEKPLPRRVITLRLDPKAAEALQALARKRGTNYSTLARVWLAERLKTELKTEAKAMRK
jgi:hypothetical protein